MWKIEQVQTEEAWLLDYIKEVLASDTPPLPKKSTKLGTARATWFEIDPGVAVIQTKHGTIDDRVLAEVLLRQQLSHHGYKQAKFHFDGSDELRKLGTWDDIMAKAKRLVQSGQVTILRNGYNNIVAYVVGDHGEYQTEIAREDPNSRTITQWQCDCPWDQYAFQRTRKWKKFEGRPCAHVLATYWKALGTPLDEDFQGQQPPGPPPPPGGGPPPGPPPPTPLPGGGIAGPLTSPGMPPPGGMPQVPGLLPPGEHGIIPPQPMIPGLMELPQPGMTPGGAMSPPNAVSVPGAKLPSPFNPIQYPGGTYSSEWSDDKSGEDLSFFDRLDMIPGAKRVTPIENTIEHNLGDRVVMDYNSTLGPEGYDGQGAWAGKNLNAGTIVDKYPHGAYDVQWDLAADPHTFELSEPGQIGENIEQARLHPEGSPYLDMALRGGLDPDRRYDLKESAQGDTFQNAEIVRLNVPTMGIAEGKSEEHGAGQWREVPKNSQGEVLSQDQTTGFIEVIFPIHDAGPLEPYHVKVFLSPQDVSKMPNVLPPGPFIKRKR